MSARQWLAAFAAGVIVALGFQAIRGGPFGASAPGPGPAAAHCTWLDREADKLHAADSRDVVLSCVACHLRTTAGDAVTFPQL
jgi:hypothetical protein